MTEPNPLIQSATSSTEGAQVAVSAASQNVVGDILNAIQPSAESGAPGGSTEQGEVSQAAAPETVDIPMEGGTKQAVPLSELSELWGSKSKLEEDRRVVDRHYQESAMGRQILEQFNALEPEDREVFQQFLQGRGESQSDPQTASMVPEGLTPDAQQAFQAMAQQVSHLTQFVQGQMAEKHQATLNDQVDTALKSIKDVWPAGSEKTPAYQYAHRAVVSQLVQDPKADLNRIAAGVSSIRQSGQLNGSQPVSAPAAGEPFTLPELASAPTGDDLMNGGLAKFLSNLDQ